MNNNSAIIHNIVYKWSAKQVLHFLETEKNKINFDINSRNADNHTALGALMVMKGERSLRDQKVAELLLVHGSDPLQSFNNNHGLITYLAMNNETKKIIQLLSYVKNINHGIKNAFRVKYTPLQVAVHYGQREVVDYLILRSADVNVKASTYLQTALHIAARSDDPEITRILLENGGNLEAKDLRGQTPLLWAAQYNMLEQVELLLRYNVNVGIADLLGHTPVHLMFLYYHNVNLELCDLLLKSGNDPNALTIDHHTPAHYLVMNECVKNKLEAMKILIKNGASLHVHCICGDSIMHKIGLNCPKNLDLICYMLKKNAICDMANIKNETFLDIFISKHFDNALLIVKILALKEAAGQFKFTGFLVRSIQSDPRLSIYHLSCRKELEEFVSKKVDAYEKYSLLDIYNSSVKKIARLCQDECLITALSSFNDEDYPVYGTELKDNFQEGFELFEGQQVVFEYLSIRSKGIIDFYSMRDIIEFIPNKAMKKVSRYLHISLNSNDEF